MHQGQGTASMTGSDLIVAAPWVIFGACLAVICARLLCARHALWRPSPGPADRQPTADSDTAVREAAQRGAEHAPGTGQRGTALL